LPQSAAAADALKKAKSQAGGSDIAGAASDAKDKAKGLLKGKGISALPGANPLAAVADLNRDVRGDAEDYRDPAGAIQQDNAAGENREGKAPENRAVSLLYTCNCAYAAVGTSAAATVKDQSVVW
jgi:hypothetical protein